MGKSQRAKGVAGELEVAHLFQDVGFRARRGIGQWQSATLVPDVVLDDLPQYWIEVKRGNQTKPLEAFDQAQKACGKKIPVAICRNNHEKHTVVMNMIDWLDMQSNYDVPLHCTFAVKVILPFPVFLSTFKEKHADKCKQLSFVTNRSPDIVATPDVRTEISVRDIKSFPDAICTQQDLFDKSGS